MLDLTFSGTGFAVGILSLTALVAATVYALRRYLNKRSTQDGTKEVLHPAARNKRPDVDVFKWTGTVLRGSLALALTLSILAFNWTTYEEAVYIPFVEDLEEDFMENIPPTIDFPKPPPPPPPPPLIEPVPDVEIDDEPILQDMSIDADTEITPPKPVVKEERPAPPVAPPPVIPEVEKPIKFAERMPRYLSSKCEALGSEEEIKQCAQTEMLQFIYKNIKYPAIAGENNVDGTVVIRFVVNKQGGIEQTEILRDPGAGLGKEALRVVEKFGKWKPGRQGGRLVPVYFNLPVRFELN